MVGYIEACTVMGYTRACTILDYIKAYTVAGYTKTCTMAVYTRARTMAVYTRACTPAKEQAVLAAAGHVALWCCLPTLLHGHRLVFRFDLQIYGGPTLRVGVW